MAGARAMTAPEHHYDAYANAHPGLHVIAAVEAAKGALALSAASGLELLVPAPLQRWIEELIKRFHLDPEEGPAHREIIACRCTINRLFLLSPQVGFLGADHDTSPKPTLARACLLRLRRADKRQRCG